MRRLFIPEALIAQANLKPLLDLGVLDVCDLGDLLDAQTPPDGVYGPLPGEVFRLADVLHGRVIVVSEAADAAVGDGDARVKGVVSVLEDRVGVLLQICLVLLKFASLNLIIKLPYNHHGY